MNPPCGATVDHSAWTRRSRRTTTSTSTGTSTRVGEDKATIEALRTRPPTPSPTRALPAPIFTAVVTQVD